MLKYYFNIIIKYKYIILMVFIVSSCGLVFEKDISKEDLQLIIPYDGQEYSTNQIQFKWVEMQYASGYQLEIVQPKFDSIQTFIYDTILTGTEFMCVLPPGEYQFRIKGVNSGYSSKVTGPYSITVDSISDLTNQMVQLLTPVNNSFTNSNNITCNWQSIYAADYYEFQLRSGLDFNASSTIQHVKTNIYSTSYTIPNNFLIEGEYSWGIRAINQNSTSSFSPFSFTIDLTVPNNVNLISPTNNTIASTQSVVFKWDNGTDPGTVNSPVYSIIEIANDSSFNSMFQIINNIYTDSLSYNFSSSGNYWWRVYAMDEAGNVSDSYSPKWKITIP